MVTIMARHIICNRRHDRLNFCKLPNSKVRMEIVKLVSLNDRVKSTLSCCRPVIVWPRRLPVDPFPCHLATIVVFEKAEDK
jgi:hypothetical protein